MPLNSPGKQNQETNTKAVRKNWIRRGLNGLSQGGLLITSSKVNLRKEFIIDKSLRLLPPLMLVVLGFFVLFDLTMILSISGNPYTIAFILIYIVLLPLWTIIRHAHIYFIVLPVPYLGSWLMSIIYLSSFALPVLQASILVSIIPVTLATMVHIFSRTRNMLGRISMTSFSRTASEDKRFSKRKRDGDSLVYLVT